jgi:hypothetical protein
MELKKTITSIFMVPTLKIDRDRLRDNGFINAYMKDGRKDVQYENAAYLLFHPKDLDKFKEFLDDEYERTKSIIDDYDYENGFVVLVYTLNPKFKKDFDFVKSGKYSKTSKEFQAEFPRVIKIKKNGLHKDEVSLQYRVFNKTEDLKKYWEEKIGIEFDDSMEVWQGFIDERETLFIDKLKEEYV